LASLRADCSDDDSDNGANADHGIEQPTLGKVAIRRIAFETESSERDRCRNCSGVELARSGLT